MGRNLRSSSTAVWLTDAAQISVSLSAREPKLDAEVNVLGGLNLLEAAVAAGARRVIFASTGGAMYGLASSFPVAETAYATPVSPYAVAKLAFERYLRAYEFMHGIEWISLRYANVYGPRQNPHGEAGVIAIFCQAILDGRPLMITGDGLQTRDYIHVSDVVRANLSALTMTVGEHRGDPENLQSLPVFNVGTARETSVLDLVRLLERILGRKLERRHVPPRPGEQRQSCLQSTLARTRLGWAPQVELEAGLGTTFGWFKGKAG